MNGIGGAIGLAESQRDLLWDVRMALDAERPTRRRGRQPGRCERWSRDGVHRIVVTSAVPKYPWYRGYRHPTPGGELSKLSHRPRWALIGWVGGEPLLMLIGYHCGQESATTRGERVPSGLPCRKCLLAVETAH